MTRAFSLHDLTPETAAMLDGATVFDHAIQPDQLAAFISSPLHRLVFARTDDKVVGFASGTLILHPDKAPTLFVNEVGVAADRRRQGIGRALCIRLMHRAKKQGCASVWLATEDDNAAARALYRSLDGRETGGIVVYDWDGPPRPEGPQEG